MLMDRNKGILKIVLREEQMRTVKHDDGLVLLFDSIDHQLLKSTL